MKNYEIFLIIKPNLDIDEVDSVINGIEETITGYGGVIAKTEKLGRKKLAYEVAEYKDGFSLVINSSMPADQIETFRRYVKLNESIIRMMLLADKKAKVAN